MPTDEVDVGNPWTLYWAYVRSYRLSGTPAQTSLDWDPAGSWSGGCESLTLSVTRMAAGLSLNVNRCEQWDMTKQNPTVDMQVTWAHAGTRSTRGVGMEIAVSVAQGAWPQWVIPSDADGSIA